jgi:hypothetical protein
VISRECNQVTRQVVAQRGEASVPCVFLTPPCILLASCPVSCCLQPRNRHSINKDTEDAHGTDSTVSAGIFRLGAAEAHYFYINTLCVCSSVHYTLNIIESTPHVKSRPRLHATEERTSHITACITPATPRPRGGSPISLRDILCGEIEYAQKSTVWRNEYNYDKHQHRNPFRGRGLQE